jgi:ribosome biogenesis GTPase A
MKNIQWFPGHMAKAIKALKEDVRLVDVVVEVCDARIPQSSRNSEFYRVVGERPKIIVLNKADMADDIQTLQWCKYYKKLGIEAVSTNCLRGSGIADFLRAVRSISSVKLSNWASKGMDGRRLRGMIVGIPNTGKSSLINKLVGKNCARTENKPGVTRKNSWFAGVGEGLELLDTPGVLPPKIESLDAAYNLAFTGAIKDAVMDVQDLAYELVRKLITEYPKKIFQRYGLSFTEDVDELIEAIGQKRGMLKSGGNVDITGVSAMILNEFRSGRLGKVTLENAGEYIGQS